MSEQTMRVTDVTSIYTGLPEGHVEAQIEQAVDALIHKAQDEYGLTFSLPLTIPNGVHKAWLIEKDGFTARYMQIYDIESGKLVTRIDMLLPTATEPVV